jgi:hypothetical protein
MKKKRKIKKKILQQSIHTPRKRNGKKHKHESEEKDKEKEN